MSHLQIAGSATSTTTSKPDSLSHRARSKSASGTNSVVVEDEPPENFVMENFTKRPRAMSHHLESNKVPSRQRLRTQARIWRALMRLGMQFHGWCPPRPPKPDFVRQIETDTIPIELLFYVPQGYSRSEAEHSDHRYPIVVCFHGGGFCIGDATDDRYFARVVMEQTKAVFVAVNYRRAPEHPFPQPVDDCVETLMWLSSHATELRLDPSKTALTGFSAGGNLCFTVPFRLTYHTNPSRPRLYPGPGSRIPSAINTPVISRVQTSQSVKAGMNPEVGNDGDLNPRAAVSTKVTLSQPVARDRGKARSSSRSSSLSLSHHLTPADSHSQLLSVKKSNTDASESSTEHKDHHIHFRKSQVDPEQHPDIQKEQQTQHQVGKAQRPTRPDFLTRATTLNTDRPGNLRIVSIVAFYPLLDWTSSRSAKVRSSRKPSATLKKTFTDLFDYSYLPPPDDAQNHISPFASPGLAPEEMIREGLPTKIQMFLCEYDMLLAEGEKFVGRLKDLGKEVYHEMIDGVPHGWDKSPNPFRNQKKIDALYVRSMRQLQAVFDEATERPEELRGDRITLGGLK